MVVTIESLTLTPYVVSLSGSGRVIDGHPPSAQKADIIQHLE
jgi:hypothetical protein